MADIPPMPRNVQEEVYAALQGMIDKAYGDLPEIHAILDQWGGAEWRCDVTARGGPGLVLRVTLDLAEAVMVDADG